MSAAARSLGEPGSPSAAPLPSAPVSAEALLGRIGAELLRQSRAVAALERTAGRMADIAPVSLSAELVRELQAFDLLRQSLEELSAASEAAGRGVPAGEIRSALRLRDLAARLFCDDVEPAALEGEVSLF